MSQGPTEPEIVHLLGGRKAGYKPALHLRRQDARATV